MASNEKKTVSADAGKKAEHHPHNRRLFLTVGTIVIFILATISFIFLPAVARTSASNDKLPPFGKYKNQPITYEYGSYFANMVQVISRQMEMNGQQTQGNEFQVFSQAFNATVINLAFTDEVLASGYMLPETLVDRTLMQWPDFIDRTTGQYSPRLYAQTTSARKMEIRKQVTQDLIQQRYASDVFGASQAYSQENSVAAYGIKQSAGEISFIASMIKGERSFEIASFPLSDFPKTEIAAYGQENPDLFVRYDLSVITLDTEEAAKKLQKQIAGNEVTFVDGISQFSNNMYSAADGKLRDQYYYYLKTIIKNPEQLDSLASLTPGDVSGVIATASGYSLFKCDWTPVQPDFTADSTIEAVHSYMRSNEAGKIESYGIAKATDFLSVASLSGFDAACRSMGITKITTTPFSLNYGSNPLLTPVPSKEFPELSGAENNENFLLSAFSLKENELSAPLLVGSNVLVLKTSHIAEDDSTSEPEEYLNMLYPYYANQFDAGSVQSYFFDPKRLQNDFFTVYLRSLSS